MKYLRKTSHLPVASCLILTVC